MRLIKLTQGFFTKVDDEDYAWLNQWKWQVARRNGVNYACRSIGKRLLLMHRVILGAKKGEYTDHRNRDGLDNRRENLRLCTQSENLRNRRLQKNNTSGFTGVSQIRNKWRAEIWLNCKKIALGIFDNIEDAIQAHEEATKEYFGKFAPRS